VVARPVWTSHAPPVSNVADVDPFLRGISIGLTVAIPVGPMAIMCVRHTLTAGAATGLFFGAGIALADTTFAAIAAIGIAAITSLLNDHEDTIRLVGGIIMMLLGISILRSGEASCAGFGRLSFRLPGVAAIITAYGLTLANPMTIIIFAGLLAGYGLGFTDSGPSTVLLVVGVFAGSMSWWALVVMAATLIRARTTESWLKRLNVIAGAAISLFGVLAAVSALR
jgi:threonine/homoserine/homoserine lactone efflux protein